MYMDACMHACMHACCPFADAALRNVKQMCREGGNSNIAIFSHTSCALFTCNGGGEGFILEVRENEDVFSAMAQRIRQQQEYVVGKATEQWSTVGDYTVQQWVDFYAESKLIGTT